ncbi:response regulator, partial [Arthrospira platensis SPKY1]|nr:response regulator [Arthrospira platensis SPKY1]
NILVVDDEPINQQVFKSHLSREHYQITKAMNGEEALQILESGERFDLVLLDVMMPRMSGYEVCQKIREKYLPLELPVIMATAKNQIADLVQGLHTGANDYIAKPFSK